ncbi:NAD-dependent epimerase/dehydratase family protein [Mycobacteroides abscessus]|uniref:NAD-dependent epimerase/dehydratase family protein n=2 Tax=Mycobacteroides abscessus TaxID=36809 RepID=UPI00026832A5|nr:NAD(P)-dependent oxidoreductase [Mycobacteroides abscessus]EIT98948.1 putative DTDP-GLUCOSE 4,6-DEHYDRATASE RMLB2 [Mycobacteroides abscessus 4S-0726-RA]EIT99666.1 putative DTDP-GLUCOSE 4,6-DEHYDRATASE RMLB2 [Mycobacteroides abscessus 4S-0303]EIU02159.1 putative DTDP-GLUCOSE 4,6-DEHYDRATASE RMLB2 [Mycobacteroides abscessus 4S-0726-RB]EIV13744.1 putative DTDP-GLUCOSE 4,6-DEHYDRATASE RMLB2 [Mycobacteroides abscessus 4S-0206]EIV52026.1 putative DTDP-GLUCOSE 4,6-DEHYDRATASE RMLB2 [Mycobacteroide
MSERRFLVTGSSGHLGEALVRTLRRDGVDVVGIDIAAGPATDIVGSIADRGLVAEAMSGMTSVLHTATLHKPHIGSHPRTDFVETNIEGTLSLLEAAVTAGVCSFVYTSTTSAFGHALVGAREAAWITEAVASVPKNIYGATKTAAEDIAHVVHQDSGLPVIVLRTSRFFPEQDDNDRVRNRYRDDNVKANEYLYRRVDLADVVDAHLLAAERGPEIGWAKYVISATTPFSPDDAAQLRTDPGAVVARYFPEQPGLYAARGWSMFPTIDRVYVNARARDDLGWQPRYDYRRILDCLAAEQDFRSPLAREIGAKGYHDEPTGVYTT